MVVVQERERERGGGTTSVCSVHSQSRSGRLAASKYDSRDGELPRDSAVARAGNLGSCMAQGFAQGPSFFAQHVNFTSQHSLQSSSSFLLTSFQAAVHEPPQLSVEHVPRGLEHADSV